LKVLDDAGVEPQRHLGLGRRLLRAAHAPREIGERLVEGGGARRRRLWSRRDCRRQLSCLPYSASPFCPSCQFVAGRALARSCNSVYVPVLFLSTRGAHPDRQLRGMRMRWTWDDRAWASVCADERRFTDGEIVWS
jgi:hypothetical protein